MDIMFAILDKEIILGNDSKIIEMIRDILTNECDYITVNYFVIK